MRKKSKKVLKKMRIKELMAVYPGLLTEKEKNILDLFVEPNVTGASIARKLNVSRQAVHDHIQRALERMESCEKTVKFLRKRNARVKYLKSLEKYIDKLSKKAPAISDDLEEMRSILHKIIKNN
jgi:predicted DNA-binding protein YlxM (UPF0122 family)